MDFQRYHRPVLGLSLILFSTAARAEAEYAPQNCPLETLELTVRNPGPDLEPYWLQIREEGRLVQEIAEEASAGETRRRPGADFLSAGQSFSVRQRGRALKFDLSCGGTTPLRPMTSPRVDFDLHGRQEPLLLRAQNLHHSGQLLNLRFLAADGRVLSEQTLSLPKSYVSVEAALVPPANTARLRLDGEARLSARLLIESSGSDIPALAPVPAEVHAPNGLSYFLLSNDSGSESFVVSTDRADLAAEARRLIAQKSYKITFALAEAAPAAGENRDFAAADASPWSWRVKELYGFNDLGHQDCSGSPSMVEDQILPGAERMICFWSFRLRRELSGDEIRTGRLRRP